MLAAATAKDCMTETQVKMWVRAALMAAAAMTVVQAGTAQAPAGRGLDLRPLRRALLLPGPLCRPRPESRGLTCTFTACRTSDEFDLDFWGWQERGAGGNLETGRAGCGGFPGFPCVFDLDFDFCFCFWVVECSGDVPDLAVLLFEAVRSGTPERSGGTCPPQVGCGFDWRRGRAVPGWRVLRVCGGCSPAASRP